MLMASSDRSSSILRKSLTSFGRRPVFFNPIRGLGSRPSVHITNSPDHTSRDGQETLQMGLASVQPHHSHGHLIAGLG